MVSILKWCFWTNWFRGFRFIIILIDPSGFGLEKMEDTNSFFSWVVRWIIFFSRRFPSSALTNLFSLAEKEHGRAECFEGTSWRKSILSPLTICSTSTSEVSFCHSGRQSATLPAVNCLASRRRLLISIFTLFTKLFTCFFDFSSSFCDVRGVGCCCWGIGSGNPSGTAFLEEGHGPVAVPSRTLKKTDFVHPFALDGHRLWSQFYFWPGRP